MSIPTNIRTLLSGNVVEWARIEFKSSWMPETSLKTICAFANDIDNWGGGYLIIGVTEKNGIPVQPAKGLRADEVDHVMKDILNKCKLIQPDYLPVVAPVEHNGRMLIVVWACGGGTRPYSSPANFSYKNGKAVATKERAYFIRKMSSTIRPSHDEISDLFTLSNKIPFDDRINHEAELTDLNITLIQSYLREIGSSLYEESKSMSLDELCASMNIINSLPEYTKPKNVALMFFCLEPQKFFPYAQIDVVNFPEGAGGDNIVEKIFTGPLHQQLREALLYIKNSIITEKIVKHPDRPEADRFFNYPLAAIEEGLSNAVYHRAYDIREPIEVRIENDVIEIISFPGPDRSVTVEGLRSFKVQNRRYRNRRIGEFLKELHLTEGRNTGFRKILNALEHNGSPLPEFETDDEHNYFITRIFVHEGFRMGDSQEKSVYKGVQLQEFILQCIRDDNKITRLELSEKFGISKSTIARQLRKMPNVKYVGGGTNGHWEIIE